MLQLEHQCVTQQGLVGAASHVAVAAHNTMVSTNGECVKSLTMRVCSFLHSLDGLLSSSAFLTSNSHSTVFQHPTLHPALFTFRNSLRSQSLPQSLFASS